MQAPRKERTQREILPAGTYLARLYSIIELGTSSYTWQGKEIASHKVQLTWELPTEMKVFDEAKGEQPRVIGDSYGFSMAPKANLRNVVVHGMLGTSLTDTEADGFDIDSLLGNPCLLSIGHQPDKNDPEIKYERILSVSPLMKGQTCPDQINPSVTLYFNDWKPEVFEKVPKWLQDKITASPEYQSMSGSKHVTTDEISADSIPF